MSKGAQQEALSALLDDEASDLEVRRLLRDLDADDEAAWSRWQMARDLMAGHRVAPVPDGFAARLGAQLGSQASARPAWTANLSRMAVAASVAAATVVGWQYFGAAGDGAAGMPTLAASQESRLPGALGETALVSGGDARVQKADPQRARQLDGMVLRHNDLSARHSGQGVMPYARLVSLQARHGSN